MTKGKEYTVEITVKDQSGEELTQGFIVKVTEDLDLGTATSLNYDRTTQLFTLNTKNNVTYKLTDNNGHVIKSGELSPLPRLEFGRSTLSEGNNTLTLQSPKETLTLTIKK